MAKISDEARLMYQTIFNDCRCVVLSPVQAAQYAGCSEKTVTKRFTGWSKSAHGKKIGLWPFVLQLCGEE